MPIQNYQQEDADVLGRQTQARTQRLISQKQVTKNQRPNYIQQNGPERIEQRKDSNTEIRNGKSKTGNTASTVEIIALKEYFKHHNAQQSTIAGSNLNEIPKRDNEIHALLPLSDTALPIDALATDKYPRLQNYLDNILNEIVEKNTNHPILEEILKNKSFEIKVTDSERNIACTDVASQTIYLDTNYFNLLSNNLQQERQVWDHLAFVISHEIAHSIDAHNKNLSWPYFFRPLYLYPEASPERDKQIEKILDSHPFTLKELNGIWDKFSDNNLKYLQKSDSAQTWYEELCSRLEPNEKSDLFLWMIGKQKNKPSSIRNEESYLGVNMDEIKDLFKFKSFRDNQVRALFAGQKGLFAKSNEFTLDRLLDQVLQDYFVKDQDKDLNKLKDIVQFSIKEIFHLENNSKKLLFMQDLADLIGADEKKDFEDFVCKTLSISPVFAKLGQALGSQVELKSKFPKLYEKLQSLKDDMSPLSYTILKKAIDTIPELADQDITIEKRIGTASIKGVWKINLNGEEYALKIRKPAIQELLEEERKEFRTLAEKITPKIKDAYALEHIPDLEKRIFYALSQECDLEIEIRNNKKLNEILGQNQNSKYQHSTPVINSKYSNSILVLDEFSEGDNLTKLQQENAPNQKVIEKEISQAFWKQALAGFIHGDPHSSNFIIKEDKIKWIDTCQLPIS